MGARRVFERRATPILTGRRTWQFPVGSDLASGPLLSLSTRFCPLARSQRPC